MNEQLNDCCLSSLIIILSSLYGFQGPDCSVAPFKMWVEVELGYYVFNVFFVLFYFKTLQRT